MQINFNFYNSSIQNFNTFPNNPTNDAAQNPVHPEIPVLAQVVNQPQTIHLLEDDNPFKRPIINQEPQKKVPTKTLHIKPIDYIPLKYNHKIDYPSDENLNLPKNIPVNVFPSQNINTLPRNSLNTYPSQNINVLPSLNKNILPPISQIFESFNIPPANPPLKKILSETWEPNCDSIVQKNSRAIVPNTIIERQYVDLTPQTIQKLTEFGDLKNALENALDIRSYMGSLIASEDSFFKIVHPIAENPEELRNYLPRIVYVENNDNKNVNFFKFFMQINLDSTIYKIKELSVDLKFGDLKFNLDHEIFLNHTETLRIEVPNCKRTIKREYYDNFSTSLISTNNSDHLASLIVTIKTNQDNLFEYKSFIELHNPNTLLGQRPTTQKFLETAERLAKLSENVHLRSIGVYVKDINVSRTFLSRDPFLWDLSKKEAQYINQKIGVIHADTNPEHYLLTSTIYHKLVWISSRKSYLKEFNAIQFSVVKDFLKNHLDAQREKLKRVRDYHEANDARKKQKIGK